MHALNCHIANIGDTVYAMIPTYYNPSHFIECKFYIEYAWHSPEHIFYHGMITELLSDDFNALKVLSTAQVKAINRVTNKLQLIQLSMPMLFDKTRIMQHMNIVQAEFKLDLPSPFIASSEEGFLELKIQIKKYFESMINSFS